MRYYPVLVDLKDKQCLVVGGGKVALRKVRRLLECGAKVAIVARELTSELQEMVNKGQVVYLGSEYQTEHLKGVFLVIGATNDEELNKRLSIEANQANILCNIVDQPEKCNFIVPSVVNKGDLIIAISTCGQSPALSKKLRQELERSFGEEYQLFLKAMGQIREFLKQYVETQPQRQALLEKIVYSDIIEDIKGQKLAQAESKIKQILAQALPHKIVDRLKVFS